MLWAFWCKHVTNNPLSQIPSELHCFKKRQTITRNIRSFFSPAQFSPVSLFPWLLQPIVTELKEKGKKKGGEDSKEENKELMCIKERLLLPSTVQYSVFKSWKLC